MSNLKYALEYAKLNNYSIIPIGVNKKPLIKWQEYQERRASPKEIAAWWGEYEDANIGIVTGKISGITVIDIDNLTGQKEYSKLVSDAIVTPMVHTPRGGVHLYYQYNDKIGTSTRLIDGIDVRNDGGYVVAPPSIMDNAKSYSWDEQLNIHDVVYDVVPDIFIQKILKSSGLQMAGAVPEFVPLNKADVFIEGRRDNDMFHTANCLVKGGMKPELIAQVLIRLASECSPPFPKKEIPAKVASALSRAYRRERNLSDEILDYVDSTNGVFTSSDMVRFLNLPTREEQKALSVILGRLVDSGVIVRHGSRDGVFRRVLTDCDEMDWRSAPTHDTPLIFPFQLENLVSIFPSNVIVIAGEPNAGKTAFMLDFIKRNMNRYEIHYFNSEMGATELKIRLSMHEDVPEDGWKFNAWERSDNFVDVIRPDAINIIDFLEISDEFYRVGGIISGIHHRLRSGICLIALQKDYKRDTGRGGSLSTEKPRLYLSMSRGAIKIVKAKNWKGVDNPNGKVMNFKLLHGAIFIQSGFWHYEEGIY